MTEDEMQPAAIIPKSLADYEMIGPETLAALLGISLRTLRSWFEAGVIPLPVRFSQRRYRWRLQTIRAWLDAMHPEGDLATEELVRLHRERLAAGEGIAHALGGAVQH